MDTSEAVDFAGRFVAGEMTDAEYCDELYSGTALDALRSWAGAPAYVGGDALQFLLEQDPATPGGRLNTLNLLADYLRAHDVSPDPARERHAQAEFDLLVRAQPAWVEVSAPIAASLLEDARGHPDSDRVRLIREAIVARYRVLHHRPRWLQAPRWPSVDGQPCTFVGQHDITAIRHDTAALYVFIHEPTGEVLTVEQVA